MRDRGYCRPGVGQPAALRPLIVLQHRGAGCGGHRDVRERPPSLAAQQRDGAGRVPRRPHARPAGDGGDRPRALPDRGRGGVFGGAALLRQLPPRDRACPQRKSRQRGGAPHGPRAHRSPPPEHGLRLRGASQRVRARAPCPRIGSDRRGGDLSRGVGRASPLRGRIRRRRPRVRVRTGRLPRPPRHPTPRPRLARRAARDGVHGGVGECRAERRRVRVPARRGARRSDCVREGGSCRCASARKSRPDRLAYSSTCTSPARIRCWKGSRSTGHAFAWESGLRRRSCARLRTTGSTW